VDTQVTRSDVLGGAQPEVAYGCGDDGHTTRVNEGHRRIAYCECGAQLAGDDEHDLFLAAQRHLAHHHPQLLGALEPDVVFQMAEDVGGATTPTGARGQST
jgi:hypothetical protein